MDFVPYELGDFGVPLALSSLQREPKLPHLPVAVSAALEESREQALISTISDS
jgi:hypothetical protein